MGTCSIKVLLKVTIIGVALRRWHNQFSNWTKGKTFWPSLPERCFYIGHSPRDNYTKFLFFCVTHRPFFLLLDYSPIICASVKRTFLLHKNCLKKIRLVKLGLAPLRCHLPILGEQATSAREAAVPLFRTFHSVLQLCRSPILSLGRLCLTSINH